MSVLTSDPKEQKFLARFEDVWASLRRYQVRQGLCWSFLAAALGLALLVVADFRLELAWSARSAGLAMVGMLTLAVLWARVVAPLRWWTRPRTAVEIEQRFPQLGQRIRTIVQYAGLPQELIDSEGVMPTLVDALEEETELQAKPLPIDAVVPWERLWAAGGLAAAPALVLMVAALSDVEWRIALDRALLGNRPYTSLAVKPGHLMVEQGESVPVAVELSGRPRPTVVLYTRPEGKPDAPWKATELDTPERGPASHRQATLEKVKDPLAYRVVAGPMSSPTYRIGVRYPLAIKAFDVAVRPPGYTGIKPSTVKGGDLRVVEGTSVNFRITFDAPPAEARLVLTDQTLRSKKDDAKETRTIPLRSNGKSYTAALTLTRGLVYQIEARTPDGRVLPKNRYKIDVQEDRAPRVAFDEPDEALEVHPIAEVLHRIRVGDDFGLTRAGIVFRFNNGDEQTLIVKGFGAKGEKSPTSAALEETLLLEKLAASQTDSVTYYAFAEDNYPSGPKRTETDLRYIDIRPFKREYKQGESGEESGEQSTTLEELIARQRFNLNRAVRLARHKPTDRTARDDPLKIAGFEEHLVGLVREFTEGVEGIAGQRVEPLHQAEESMLAAVAALDRSRNVEAPRHMTDALRHLIAVRDTIRQIIAQDPAMARALRNFDRKQAQKIRRDKKKDEDAEELAAEIEQLAQEEDFVYATLAASSPGEAEGKSSEADTGEKDAEKPADESKKDAEASKGQQGQAGQDGQKGPRGEGRKPGPEEDKGARDAKTNERRDASERQEKIADEARAIEEKLKKLEDISDLAKARMAKAAEKAEKASGALARGNTKEATEDAKAGAAMLHELARQVKGEVAREVADQLAMARDLADELAEREADLAQMEGAPGEGETGQRGSSSKPAAGRGGSGGLTDAERLERIEEAAKTLEALLEGAKQRAEGKAGEQVRELIEQGPATEIVARVGRVGELYLGGQRPEARREASELSRTLEVLARQLDVLHRGIVAPELAALVEYDRRVAKLTESLKTLKTDADLTEWHRQAAALVRDLQKAGLTRAATALTEMMDAGGWNAGGRWHWGARDSGFLIAPEGYSKTLRVVVSQIQDKIQELALKDLKSSRDEATPPEFKELVERYYEVLSKDTGR